MSWPLCPPMDDQNQQSKYTDVAAFVIRLVQQKLIDEGFLAIAQSTGRFLDQTKTALVNYKIQRLNVPANTSQIECIGPTTLKALFPTYNAYKMVYDKVIKIYQQTNEKIPMPLAGLSIQNQFGGPEFHFASAITLFDKTPVFAVVGGDQYNVDAKTDIGVVKGVTPEGWVLVRPNNQNEYFWVALANVYFT